MRILRRIELAHGMTATSARLYAHKPDDDGRTIDGASGEAAYSIVRYSLQGNPEQMRRRHTLACTPASSPHHARPSTDAQVPSIVAASGRAAPWWHQAAAFGLVTLALMPVEDLHRRDESGWLVQSRLV